MPPSPRPYTDQALAKAEWKKRLSPPAYNVLREEGTERAGTSPLNYEKRDGSYRKLQVRIKRDGYAARTRSGYYAPKN